VKLTPWMLTVSAFGIISLLAVGFLLKKLWAAEVVEAPKSDSRVLPMALQDLQPGVTITRSHVGNGPWSRGTGEPLAPDTILSVDNVIGRIVKEPIKGATPLRGSMFYAPGDLPDQKVAEGKRAVAIRVSETTATLLQKMKPEQYVDVQLTVDNVNAAGGRRSLSNSGTASSSGDTSMTLTLFKGVKLVSLNRSTSNSSSANDSQNVTLELDEAQARIALLAQQKGEIDLIYNPNGPGTGGIEIKTENDRVTLRELLGLKE
jgi:Flp pilus assembly protein CpaB